LGDFTKWRYEEEKGGLFTLLGDFTKWRYEEDGLFTLLGKRPVLNRRQDDG
jgi:hypothetical protein